MPGPISLLFDKILPWSALLSSVSFVALIVLFG